MDSYCKKIRDYEVGYLLLFGSLALLAAGALCATVLIVLRSLFFKTIGIIRTIRPLRGRVSAVVSAVGALVVGALSATVLIVLMS